MSVGLEDKQELISNARDFVTDPLSRGIAVADARGHFEILSTDQVEQIHFYIP